MNKEQEKWAIFWCELLSPVIYGDIEPELTNQFLKQIADKQITFPTDESASPPLRPCAASSIAIAREDLTPCREKSAGIEDNLAVSLQR
ncbi:MAG: hypothetical protein ACE5J5_07875 [Candidatus Hydrothermarchaeales archaeon]